jgi:hypothetical protein
MPLKLYWPTTNNRLLQRFREHPEWYKGFGLPGHEGLDFSVARGSEIYACADGVVAEVRLDAEMYAQTHQGTYAYGNQVRIRHALPEGEYFTVYAHLLEARVQPGDPIKAGQLVGLGDSTGNSTGDHLHLTLKKTGSTAAGETDYPRDLIDPEPFLQPFGVKPESTGDTGTPETPTTPQGTDGLKYVADVTIPDGTTLKAGESFTKTWRVTNTGTNAWGSGYILRFAEGNQLSGPNSFPLAPAQPGQTIEISIPLHAPGAPGRYVSKWTAANALGYSFGATITTVIVVAAQPAQIPPPVTPTPPVPADALKFLGDSNFPPGGMVLGGQRLAKTWKIENTGSATWGNGYELVYVSGETIQQASFNPLPALQPGQQGEVSVMVITPINPGSYQCVWQARNPQGQLFGDLLVFEFSLQVGEPQEQ